MVLDDSRFYLLMIFTNVIYLFIVYSMIKNITDFFNVLAGESQKETSLLSVRGKVSDLLF